jgi:hypothetical protein
MTLEETSTDREQQRALTFLVVSGDDRDAWPKAVNHCRRYEPTEVAYSNAPEKHRSPRSLAMYAIEESEGAPRGISIEPFQFLANPVDRPADEAGGIYCIKIVLGWLRC